jgi:hypothetical protein
LESSFSRLALLLLGGSKDQYELEMKWMEL